MKDEVVPVEHSMNPCNKVIEEGNSCTLILLDMKHPPSPLPKIREEILTWVRKLKEEGVLT